ncbi:zinc finger protein ZAT4-like [Hibiscus syriacus]|uniref:zinc finger protein ZAT4-like n=1 Tax=Hibiscus syriacus TaxID=106335 RepID=UPI0019228EDA|nr:zinc finger protein ZAT4-like [Hibiscus syriacus]
MDKHKCRLCFKSFANGRALGGHMRSHMFNLPLPPKLADHEPTNQLIHESESASASASYSSSSEEEKGQSYGVRENPKRSVRLVDPVFVHAAGSVVLQDREKETYESQEHFKSSKVIRTSRGKYRCEKCNKVFKSYQALGGHRASHKKTKPYSPATHETVLETENMGTTSRSITDKKIHECPVCFRVFSSGQALGGHKRSHVINGQAATTLVKISRKLKDSFIDLNLPAPTDEDDASQIELSAVSDAEFANRIK